MSMRLHERFMRVREAEVELQGWCTGWMDRHDLTYLEAIGALLSEALNLKKYALRTERHPEDPDKGGDEA
jgi:hypothetical protein